LMPDDAHRIAQGMLAKGEVNEALLFLLSADKIG